jgi:hypothetical protein
MQGPLVMDFSLSTSRGSSQLVSIQNLEDPIGEFGDVLGLGGSPQVLRYLRGYRISRKNRAKRMPCLLTVFIFEATYYCRLGHDC